MLCDLCMIKLNCSSLECFGVVHTPKLSIQGVSFDIGEQFARGGHFRTDGLRG